MAHASDAIGTPRTSLSTDRGPRISYEFFPPKSDEGAVQLWDTIAKLERLQPEYVSVTYGAGGTTKERTLGVVERLVAETKMEPAAHLTCVDATRAETDAIADRLWKAGVRHIVALRGDAPGGFGAAYEPHPEGYPYSPELVEGLRRRYDFRISVSGYPELHPDSRDWDAEIDVLKRKVDAGASAIVTQFFFTADVFLRYRDRLADAGISTPVVPGVMLQPNVVGLEKMAGAVNVSMPDWYRAMFEDLADDLPARRMLTAAFATDLAGQLYDEGVRDFHLYTLNRSEIAEAVTHALGGAHRHIRASRRLSS